MKSRLYCILGIILFCFCIIIFRMLDISIMQEVDINQNNTPYIMRGNIYDRNGVILAGNLPTKSMYIKPEQITNIDATAKLIAKVMEQYCVQCNVSLSERIASKITTAKNFVWIKRHVLPEEYIKIKALGIPGVYFAEDNKRFYPYENTFSHLIGFVDIDQNGIAGIERQFNETLSKGSDITITLDTKIQDITHFKLKKYVTEHDALGGMAVIMNANNGEIISMVSLPDFNPNTFKSKDQEAMFNRVTLGVYEMGSTFKILTVAMGLDLGVVKLGDSFNVAHPMKLGKYKINDYRFHKANLSLSEVLIFSSNRGIAQVGYKIGIINQQKYMKKIGMLKPINLEISEVGKPIHVNFKQWNDVYLATISYGHGIAVTALHNLQAIAAVVNGGILYKSTILPSSEPGERVFKESTSQTMRKIMRRIVEEGYAKKSDVAGYNIGGKTGTAEKVKHGKYIKKDCNLVLFVGAFPIDKPEYVMLVAIDEPKANKANLGFTTGGMIAAPLAAEIIQDAGHLLSLIKH